MSSWCYNPAFVSIQCHNREALNAPKGIEILKRVPLVPVNTSSQIAHLSSQNPMGQIVGNDKVSNHKAWPGERDKP